MLKLTFLCFLLGVSSLFAISKRQLNTVENACVCQIELHPNLEVSPKEQLAKCVSLAKESAESVYSDPALTLTEKEQEKVIKSLLARYQRTSDEDKNYITCDADQIKDWFKTYKGHLKESPLKLKMLVEQNICEASFCDKDGNKQVLTDLGDYPESITGMKVDKLNYCTGGRAVAQVTTCTDSLSTLLAENLDSVYKDCNAKAGQFRKGEKLTDECVRINIYNTLILNEKDNILNKEFCQEYAKGEIKIEDCKKQINQIKKAFAEQIPALKEEIKICEAKEKFNTQKAADVCVSVIVNKLLAFATMAEKKALFHCINNSKGEAIKACYDKFLVGQDEDEKQLLEHIQNQYCSHLLTEEEQKDCVKGMLAHFMNQMDVPEACMYIEDEVEKSKCMRKELYNFILAQDSMKVQDCWDKSKYPTIEERQTCTEENEKLFAQINQCHPHKEAPITRDTLACFEKIQPTDKINEYIKKLAASINQELYKKCMQSTTFQKDCLFDIIDNKTYAEIDSKYCPSQPNPDQCYADFIASKQTNINTDDKIDAFNSEIDKELAEGGVSNTRLDLARNSNGTGVEGEENPGTSSLDPKVMTTLAGAGITLTGAAGAGASLTSSGNGKNNNANANGQFSDLAGGKDNKGKFISLVKDWKFMWTKGSDPACKALRKAAWVRMGGLVLGMGAITYAGVKAGKAFKEAKEKQSGSWKGIGIILAGTAAGAGIKYGANLWSKNILGTALAAEQVRFNSSGTPIYCQKEQKKTSSYFEFKDFDEFKQVAKVVKANINRAQSQAEVDHLFSEWESYLQGKSYSYDENHLDYLFAESDDATTLAFVKNSLVTSIEYMSDIIFPAAQAKEDQKQPFDIGKVVGSMDMIKMFGGVLEDNGFNPETGGATTEVAGGGKKPRSKKNVSKLDQDISRVPALYLLYEYDEVVGSGVVESKGHLTKAEQDVKKYDVLIKQFNANPSKEEK